MTRFDLLRTWSSLLGARFDNELIAYLASEIFSDVPVSILKAAVDKQILSETRAVPARLREAVDSGEFGKVTTPVDRILIRRTRLDVVYQDASDRGFSLPTQTEEYLTCVRAEAAELRLLDDPQTSDAFCPIQELQR